MTEKQTKRLEELRIVLMDMAGDVIALESFLRCQPVCEAHFGRPTSEEWLQRIRDYLKQHMNETQQLTDWLLKSAEASYK